MAWRRARPDRRTVVAVWLPLLCLGVLAWDRRWMSDDGYINVRIVWHLLHGHGPVFNIGERVEAGTSPLWIAVLAAARVLLWFVDPAWVAVLTGIALTLSGVGLAIVGARAWWAGLGRQADLPAGAAVLVGLPPLWDFASSGLETGLSFAWLGACWWAVTRRLGAGAGAGAGEPRPLHDPWWIAALVGLGPLVRPDFAVFTVAFAVALAATSRRRRADWARASAIGLALPVAYQVFRMGYYGLLVPNTALAKEAGRSLWARGWMYLEAYVDGTLLPLSLAVLALLGAVSLRGSGVTTRHGLVAVAPIGAGALHALYVVRVGGDFMYGRLLLPATFAVLCPLAALPLPLPVPATVGRAVRRVWWSAVAGLAAVVVLVGGFRRWVPDDPIMRLAMNDERATWTLVSGRSHPVTLGDYADVRFVEVADRLPQPHTIFQVEGGRRAAAPRPAVESTAIGMIGTRLVGTHIVDHWSLAEPVGSHLEGRPDIRAGHEKPLPWDWTVARFGAAPLESAEARAARAALACGDLAELVAAVEDPLTPGRFLRNLVGALDRTRLRVPADPREARARLCG